MNCRQVRELISAYLDQELTGHEMLEINAHLRLCHACAREWQDISEVRRLLRSLLPQSPAQGAEQRLLTQLAAPEVPFWHIALESLRVLRPLNTPRPRGRRLATALALSSVVVLAVAAPFAPPTNDAARYAGGSPVRTPTDASMFSLPGHTWEFGLLPQDRPAAMTPSTVTFDRLPMTPDVPTTGALHSGVFDGSSPGSITLVGDPASFAGSR